MIRAENKSYTTFGEAWSDRLYQLLTYGRRVAPRGLETVEQISVSFTVEDLRQNVLVHPVRDLNYRFMVAEWFWIILGSNDLKLLTRFNSRMAQFSDDGRILTGAYGPRIAQQWDWAIEQLRRSPDTRQSVITVWTPTPKPSKDIPCTVSLQFLLRERLHLVATMRSSDTWLGLPYDFFTFSQLANEAAGLLGVPRGSLTMQLGSSHLYKDQLALAESCLGVPADTLLSPPLNHSRPGPERLTEALERRTKITTRKDAWSYYEKALAVSGRREALEVLSELNARIS